jgi:AmpD protein
LRRLCLDLHRHYPIAHIAGHEHIAPGRKHDPGAGFDWMRLKTSVKLPNRYFPLCL